jgi:hypothetical protein
MKRGTKSKKRGTKQGTDLAERMMQDKEFMVGVERGLKDMEEGHTISLEDLKHKLGDTHTIVGVLAHPCNIYRK